ncbi:MAG: zinc ribbon domain-containing protein, partial [Anaerolineales bacterium]|nr:zinc ribbon domain-containing protein [Anaerolineales bacterium]
VMLFVRGVFYLLLIDLAGEAAAMATLTSEGFSAFMEQTLAPLAAVPAPAVSATGTCPKCGAPISPTARFCGQCGTPLRI